MSKAKKSADPIRTFVHLLSKAASAVDHPVFELRCGIVTLRDKVEAAYDTLRVSVHCRSYLAQVLKERFPDLDINKISGSPRVS